MHASAAMATLPSTPPAAPAGGRPAVRADLVGPVNGSGTGDGTIQLDPLTTGSFTQGTRGTGGVRYFWATFRVRNAQADSVAYDTPRQNLTFFATATDGTLGGSAIASLERFDSSQADAAIAPQILPTGAVDETVAGGVVSRSPDVLQVLTADEAAAVSAPAGVTVLPYGFVVHNVTDNGRSLPASPAADQYDGVVTFAFKVPLQASAATDPFTISAMFLGEDDGETQITQSLEEQTSDGEAAFLARAQAIGATMRTVLPGSDYTSDASDTRTVCTVPTTAANATTPGYLVHRALASVTLDSAAFARPLSAGGSVARDLGLAVQDSSGTVFTDVPGQFNLGTPGVVTLSGPSRAVMVLRRDRASTTVSFTACGMTSETDTIHTSGYTPLAEGDSHSLAVTADDTVAAWGSNVWGQTTIPAGLTGVVQVAASVNNSLALKSDGTVVGWGTDNSHGQTTVPAGLTDVVQIAAGHYNSLALKADGTVVGWGPDDAGQTIAPTGLVATVP